ncbi:MAG: hypothetical protein ACLSCX_09465, partial [Oscillospiraceae bacterium]
YGQGTVRQSGRGCAGVRKIIAICRKRKSDQFRTIRRVLHETAIKLRCMLSNPGQLFLFAALYVEIFLHTGGTL